MATKSACGIGLLLFLASLASAQPGQEGVVQGTGTATLKRAPDQIRVQIQLVAEGKTLKEALEKLKERQELVRTFFAGIGADKDGCVFEQPKLSGGLGDSSAQMDMMIRARMMQSGRGMKPAAKKDKEAPKVAVSVSCKAEAPLKGASAEERLIAAQALQEKIKAANLSGHKDLAKPTAQDAEAAEEAQAEMQDMMGGMGGEAKPGEPAFSYVARFTDEEMEKAEKEAFAKAKKEAERLARVAGASLGSLRTLHSNASAVVDPDDQTSMAYRRYAYAMAGSGIAPERDESKPQEAVGMDPTQVVFKVQISAGFLLK